MAHMADMAGMAGMANTGSVPRRLVCCRIDRGVIRGGTGRARGEGWTVRTRLLPRVRLLAIVSVRLAAKRLFVRVSPVRRRRVVV